MSDIDASQDAPQQEPVAELDASADAGASQVQAKKDAEEAKGYRGVKVDPTPNENYSFGGQAAGAPTPETHDEQAAAAAEHARKVARGEVTD